MIVVNLSETLWTSLEPYDELHATFGAQELVCITLQKRAVRLINFAPFRSHAVPYFLHSNIMPITMLYFKLSSMLMFDVYNNTAPHNISHLFIPTQQIHSYSTRSSSSGNYYISRSRLNQKNDSFSIMGAKILE